MGKLIVSIAQEGGMVMETVRIGVIVKDKAYRNALLRGLSHESRDFQFVSIDAGREDVNDRSGVIGSCQIILADPDLIDEHADLIPEQVTLIRLTYHEMYDLGDSAGSMEIFRYEDARVFVNKIIYYYSRKNGIDLYFHGRKKCRKRNNSRSPGQTRHCRLQEQNLQKPDTGKRSALPRVLRWNRMILRLQSFGRSYFVSEMTRTAGAWMPAAPSCSVMLRIRSK